MFIYFKDEESKKEVCALGEVLNDDCNYLMLVINATKSKVDFIKSLAKITIDLGDDGERVVVNTTDVAPDFMNINPYQGNYILDFKKEYVM